jgi:hypothetical protein
MTNFDETKQWVDAHESCFKVFNNIIFILKSWFLITILIIIYISTFKKQIGSKEHALYDIFNG